MDRGSIENWKSHVKQNGAVYSVQYTKKGLANFRGMSMNKRLMAQGVRHKESF